MLAQRSALLISSKNLKVLYSTDHHPYGQRSDLSHRSVNLHKESGYWRRRFHRMLHRTFPLGTALPFHGANMKSEFRSSRQELQSHSGTKNSERSEHYQQPDPLTGPRALAVRYVTRNKGAMTPGGGPGTLIFIKTEDCIPLKNRRSYRPCLYAGSIFLIQKNGKLRPRGISTVLDLAMQALYLMALLPLRKKERIPTPTGFAHISPPRTPYRNDLLSSHHRTRRSGYWILSGI